MALGQPLPAFAGMTMLRILYGASNGTFDLETE